MVKETEVGVFRYANARRIMVGWLSLSLLGWDERRVGVGRCATVRCLWIVLCGWWR